MCGTFRRGLEATLTGHEGTVCALVVEGRRLYSSSKDKTIRMWDAGTWAEWRSVAVYDANEAGQCPACLLTSGSKLISGSAYAFPYDDSAEQVVRVWDLDTLACEHTVRQEPGADVRCLAGAGGAVWGGVGQTAVVWERD